MKRNVTLKDFSAVVYNKSILFLTGGSDHSLCDRFVFENLKQLSSKNLPTLKCYGKKLSPLNQERFCHNSFILNDFLFVIFGMHKLGVYAKNLEYLDLKVKDHKNPEFYELDIQSKENKHQILGPMLFIEDERVLFFGGHIDKLANTQSILQELVIEWRNGTPTKATLKKYKGKHGNSIVFPGSPVFNQRIPNQRYFYQLKSWTFVDDTGKLYLYNTNEGTVDVKQIDY